MRICSYSLLAQHAVLPVTCVYGGGVGVVLLHGDLLRGTGDIRTRGPIIGPTLQEASITKVQSDYSILT